MGWAPRPPPVSLKINALRKLSTLDRLADIVGYPEIGILFNGFMEGSNTLFYDSINQLQNVCIKSYKKQLLYQKKQIIYN